MTMQHTDFNSCILIFGKKETDFFPLFVYSVNNGEPYGRLACICC